MKNVVVDTTKVQFFKQITTGGSHQSGDDVLLLTPQRYNFSSKSQHSIRSTSLEKCCCWHHKGTIFQANHNGRRLYNVFRGVVVDTTKVQFFKQITTKWGVNSVRPSLLLTPQRYNFSSKSQHSFVRSYSSNCCCWHHKGTIFQANHNKIALVPQRYTVVVDTTKVQFFKQITTKIRKHLKVNELLLTPQRYNFSSKSQQ